MSLLSKDLKWTTTIAAVLAFGSHVMTSADVWHRDTVTPAPIAYTQYYCFDEGCSSLLSSVVTPGSGTGGFDDSMPTWSPDATHVAFSRSGDIAVVDTSAGTVVNITNTAAQESLPVWSPDGQRIAFVSDRDGLFALYVMNPDGSGVARVTDQGVGVWRPSWSPDSTRLAYSCIVEAGNNDICTIKTDGTSLLRLTDDPAYDAEPAWSPDGSTFVFVSSRFNGHMQFASMSADGTAITLLGSGVIGWQPAWSPDGRQIAFASAEYSSSGNSWLGISVFTMRADGTDISLVSPDAEYPAWKPGALFASFSVACSGLTCTLDAAHSVGDVTAYTWNFGDQSSGTGSGVTHTYKTGGYYTIELTVTGASGATSTSQDTIYLNVPPVASFTVSCGEQLMCLFDPSASHDPDGNLYSVLWTYGDGTASGCGGGTGCLTPRQHLYSSAGTYTVTLQIIDGAGATSTTSQTLTFAVTPSHIGDLDAAISPGKGPWSATVTIAVHAGNHNPVAGAVVAALWDNGVTMYCLTDATGRCSVRRSGISPTKSASVSITGLTDIAGVYSPAANHDPDGDSNGTLITISKR